METLVNNNYKTAIKRGGPSAPIRWLENHFQRELLDQRTLREFTSRVGMRVLDYGCGRGEDAEYLGAEKYDPYWHPVEPTGRYDLILCTYVLNVLERSEQQQVLERLEDLRTPDGAVFVTVRRDVSIFKPIQRDGYRQLYVMYGDMFIAGYYQFHERKNNWGMFTKGTRIFSDRD